MAREHKTSQPEIGELRTGGGSGRGVISVKSRMRIGRIPTHEEKNLFKDKLSKPNEMG